MRIVHWGLLLWACLSLASCSFTDDLSVDESRVEIVFKTNQIDAKEGESENSLSILVFKYADSGKFSFFPNSDYVNWETDGKGAFTKKIILPSGKYRFLMARGFTSDPNVKDRALFQKGETAVGGYDGDYNFSYPSTTDEESKLQLSSCPTELFMDANAAGFEPNDTEYALTNGNKFVVSRKMTRVQGRFDFMIRRGERGGDGSLKIIPEGDNNKDARENALKKITYIQIKAENVSSQCHINGLQFANPSTYSFKIQNSDFGQFNASDFVKELDGVDTKDYLSFDHSAYNKGPLLFPAPNNEVITLSFTINYEFPLAPKKISKKVKLERNKVSLVVLWLLNEEIGVDVGLNEDDLVFKSGQATGDDGFWN